VKLNVVVINDARDSSYDLFPPVRQEKDHLGMGTEGMIRAKFLKLIFDERRDPVSVALINLPGESNEGHEVLLIF
jgi:hypothetical protein